MKKLIIEELKRNASRPGKEKTWISLLSEDQIYEIFIRLKNGESGKAIAAYVQKIWKINPHAKIHSLSQGVIKFKKRINHLLISETKNIGCQKPFENDEDREDIYSGESLEELAIQQEKRIKQMIQEENKNKVKYPHLNREIQCLASLRKALIKQRDWEIKNGQTLIRGNKTKLSKNSQKRFESVVKGFNFDDDALERLTIAANKFLELAEQESIIMDKEPD